jgi:DNA polymerase I
MGEQMPKLFLLDLMSMFFRSHMAMDRNPLTNAEGLVVSGIYGVIRQIGQVIRTEKPDAIFIATDTSKPTFRHKMYDEYKANRPPMPAEMVSQIPILYELLELAGVKPLAKAGLEADDILATCAKQSNAAGWECFVLTADKDLMQIVGPGISLYNTRKGGEVFVTDREAVINKFAVPPEKVIEVLALMGDASDNVPGVPRVGPKTAGDLVSRYGNIEGIYENLEDLGKKAVRRYLEENRDLAYLSRDLVTIDADAEFEFSVDELQLPDFSNSDFQRRMMDFGFQTLLRQISPATSAENKQAEKVPELQRVYHTVHNKIEFEEFRKVLLRDTIQSDINAVCSFDLETTGLDSLNCKIVGFSFSWVHGEAWYVPAKFCPEGAAADTVQAEMFSSETGTLFATDQDDVSPDLQWILDSLKEWYENPAVKKMGQNCKYDINVLSQYGIAVSGIEFDTMLASFALRPVGRQHNLDALALHYLGMNKVPTKELIGSGVKQISMADVPLDKIAFYACEDADVVLQISDSLKKELSEAGLTDLINKIDIPTMEMLCRVEQNGVSLDVTHLEKLSIELQEEMDLLEKEIYELAGEEFNINSPKQLAEILFNKIGMKPGKKTKTGYSTDVRELERLAADNELPGKLLEFRQLAKIRSTYSEALPRMINPRTGKVHTNFNQTIAATGRLSSTDPNLQNIPIRTSWGEQIRAAFIPASEGRVLIDADYSQIELRLLAHLSQDEELVKTFRNGGDIHARTGSAIFGVNEMDVSSEMRRMAKIVNFGVIYGMGPYALSGNLDVSISEAKSFIDEYYKLYHGVFSYSQKVIADARNDGYVVNLFGRRRYLPEIDSANRQLRENTERIAMNTPIQGSAADLIKIAMIDIDNWIRKESLDLQMISQVHDELLFETTQEKAPDYSATIRKLMEDAVELSVPLVVEPCFGLNWLKAK